MFAKVLLKFVNLSTVSVSFFNVKFQSSPPGTKLLLPS